MRTATCSSRAARMLRVSVLLGCFSIYAVVVSAQGSQGQNAVYNSTNGIVGSSAFYDASVFATGSTTSTVCSVLYSVLGLLSYPLTTGAVIDARGLNAGNTNMTCAGGTTPLVQRYDTY